MQKGVTADRLDHQNCRETDHGKTTVDPLGVGAPTEGGDIGGGGGGLRNRSGCRGLAGGGHPAGSGTPEVIAGRRHQTPATVTAQLQHRIMELLEGGPVADADHRQLSLAQQGIEVILRRHIQGAGGFIQHHDST